MTPTARTLAYLRKVGLRADVVERWIPHINQRKDLFGIIDILVIDSHRILGIQATSGSNHAARAKKALASENLRPWLESGSGFSVWSWRKLIKRNKDGTKSVRPRWALRRTILSHNDRSGEINGTEEELPI